MDYREANILLQGRCRERRKIANNTWLERDEDGTLAVRLHNTRVLIFHKRGDVTVQSGGWNTVTTKNRINRYLPSPYRAFSDSQRYGRAMVVGGAGKGLAVVPCTISVKGAFSKKTAKELQEVMIHCAEDRKARARERYKVTFWMRKAREGGKTKKPLTLAMIQAERNTTVRAAMIKVYGLERFLTQVEAQTLDTHGEYRLVSYALNTWQNIRALKMVCPSTQTVYIHPVDPRCDTVAKALDWMFQTEGYLNRLQAEA